MKDKLEKIEKKSRLSTGVKFTILAIVLIAIFSVCITPVTLQNDTYYTIKVGEHIAKTGIDMQDPFSWHENLGYTYPHWGYDLITYLIYNATGMAGIYVTTCILSAILGISIYLVNTKLAKNQIISFLLTIGVMYLIKDYIAARAQLVTFIFFILTIFLIEKFLSTKKKRYAAGLIVIPIMIANLHVAVFPFYFVLFLPYVAEYLIAVLGDFIIYRKAEVGISKIKIKRLSKKPGNQEKVQILESKLKELKEKIDRIKVKRTKDLQNPYKIKIVKNDNTKWLIVIMIICIFAGLLTPLGTTPYTYLAKTMEGNTTQSISEHQPMTLSNEKEILCVIVMFLAILIFTKVKIRLSDLLMIAGTAFLMISSRRQMTVFVIIGSVILNKLIISLVEIYEQGSLEKATKAFTTKIGMILTTIIVLLSSYVMVKDKLDDKFINDASYPVAACDYILQNIDLGQAKFYNEYNYGSYMLFRGIPVFIDSRADLYSPEFSGKDEDIFSDFIETSNIGKFYEDTFEKYNITHVITYKNSKTNMIITKTKDSKYKELYSDDHFVIYEREK